jgi:hypothetical protein
MTELYYEWNKGDAPHLLSTYFSTSEFSCKCSYPECVRQKIAIELVDKLTRVRAPWASLFKSTAVIAAIGTRQTSWPGAKSRPFSTQRTSSGAPPTSHAA